MRPATDVLRTGQWAGEPAFVIGGGPSLRGFDFSRLRGLHTIVCNAALLYADQPEIFLAADDWLIGELVKSDQWRQPWTIKLAHAALHERGLDFPDTYWLRVQKSRFPWGTRIEEGIAGFSNTGLGALNLADILGADPIFLLGFDMRPTPGRIPLEHFHDYYPRHKWINAEAVCRKFMMDFQKHGGHCRARVLNCSLDSALEMFPKITIEEALAQCTTSSR